METKDDFYILKLLRRGATRRRRQRGAAGAIWYVPASEWRQAESGHRRGPKTVLAQTAEVMSFSLFSLDFKPKVQVVMLFLW
jgi:hypothetical protein